MKPQRGSRRINTNSKHSNSKPPSVIRNVLSPSSIAAASGSFWTDTAAI